MDPVEDTLRRLREAFNAGRTRPAEFRVEQLKGLSRFLQDNRQLLQDALAQDLHKVTNGEWGRSMPGAAMVVQLGQREQANCILQEGELKAWLLLPWARTRVCLHPSILFCIHQTIIYQTSAMCWLVPVRALGMHKE
jgi:hypothetical protein